MSFRDKFLGVSKNQTDWTNNNEIVLSESVNDERLTALRREVKSAFDQGIERLAQGQMASAVVLQGEIAYQADRLGNQLGTLIQSGSSEISSAVEQGSADIVSTIQRMSDYLGAAFSDIRWAVERQTQVTQEALHSLLHVLDNQSRQYFEQGVECYEMGEYELADERFAKALSADPTNPFVYQYLGFIAVAEDQSREALHNFTLARKFADNPYHRALALSHLARSYHATGQLREAADLARQATEIHPHTAKFWYEAAGYQARAGDGATALVSLREAIQHDWTYWAVVLSDTDFDNYHKELQVLLAELRSGEKDKARQGLEVLQQSLNFANRQGLGERIVAQAAAHHSLAQRLNQENVYVFQDIAREAQAQRKQIFDLLITDAHEQKAQKEQDRIRAEQERKHAVQELEEPVKIMKGLRNQILYNYQVLQVSPAGICLAFGVLSFIFYGLTPYMEQFGVIMGLPAWMLGCAVLVWGVTWALRPLHHWFFLTRPRHRIEANMRAKKREIEPLRQALDKDYQTRQRQLTEEIKSLDEALARYEQEAKLASATVTQTPPLATELPQRPITSSPFTASNQQTVKALAGSTAN